MLVFLLFLRIYELPAITQWNPCGTYTPSATNPRCGYHLVPENSEFSIGFSILSIFTPLKFQEYFPVVVQQRYQTLS